MLKKIVSSLINHIPLLQSKQRARVINYYKENNGKTPRLDYDDLNNKSIVFDLGGFEGQWASDIFAKYCCEIYIFEPYLEYYQNIKKRFLKNDKMKIYPFGLSDSNKNIDLSISGDSSSAFKNGANTVKVDLKHAIDFLTSNNINKINLLKINIEGGEYELLEHLIEHGFITKIENIQVQFHDFIPNAEIRMKNIQKELAKSHFTTYQFEFVWENWKLQS